MSSPLIWCFVVIILVFLSNVNRRDVIVRKMFNHKSKTYFQVFLHHVVVVLVFFLVLFYFILFHLSGGVSMATNLCLSIIWNFIASLVSVCSKFIMLHKLTKITIFHLLRRPQHAINLEKYYQITLNFPLNLQLTAFVRGRPFNFKKGGVMLLF